jgi:pimeloyl-ACP methyl ester carboxylesterase
MPTLPIEDGTLWYDEHGSGPPMVCIHGGWQDSDAWRDQLERFADEYRVIRMDIRGHGKTGATDTRRYSIEGFTDDLERLLDHLEVEDPILCGISIGGMIVQTYLDRHPEGARAAVIGGPVQSMPPVDVPPQVKPFLSPVPAISAVVSTVGTRTTFQWLLASIRATVGNTWLTVDPEVRVEALEIIGEISPAEYTKIFRALYDYVPPDLSAVGTPTLVLAGDHEAPPVTVQAKRLAATLPNGSYREIADAGHLVNQDRPTAFNEAVAGFLATLETADGQRAPA